LTPRKPATLFIDRCLGKHVIAQALRQAGATVELHDEHFSQNERDSIWLAEVGRRGWIVLTKDQRFQKRFPEIAAIAAAGVAVFQLGTGNMPGAEMSELLSKNWQKLVSFSKGNRAPFIARLNKSGRITLFFSSTQLRKFR
jgi:predicted nuclease of predicted toxin-antitoxin system